MCSFLGTITKAYPESLETSKIESFATIVIGFQPLTIVTKLYMFEGVLLGPMDYYCVRFLRGLDIAMTNIETTLKQRCFNVVSTLCNVENPTLDFVSFSTSEQPSNNAETTLI